MSPEGHRPKPRSVLLSFKFLGVSLVGALAMALVSAFAPLPAQVAVLGALVSILAGLFVSYLEQEAERDQQRSELLEKLQVPVSLAPEHDLFSQYSAFSHALTELSKQRDPVLREYALLKLASLCGEVESLARGTLILSSTETWRTVYEDLLSSKDLREYLSVAWVKTREYWQDQPGRQSMRVNYQFIARGGRIERIVILRGDLWPQSEPLPSLEIRPWIEEQYNQDVWVSLVRESDLASEGDLLSDFGIYGERATGIQELDEQSRTLRFILQFDSQSLKLARDRWQRLSLYATAYSDLVDRVGGEG